jgi:aspartyl-tRNA(Asn)/glutamyl-tRNA(Gln) amidotransferase subunit B
VLKALNDNKIGITEFSIGTKNLSELLALIKEGAINQNTGKDVFDEMLKTGKQAKIIVDEKGLSQIHDEGLIEKIVDEVIKESTTQVEQYRSGKTAVMGFLVGQVMKKSGGKAKPAVVNELLKKKLG